MDKFLGKRSLVRAAFVVFVVWYFALYVVAQRLHVPEYARFSYVLAALVAGALIGTGGVIGWRALQLHWKDRGIRAGHEHEGACVSLGRLPGVDDDAGDGKEG